ncbi:hypothetical protein L2E82_33320 [Cichorium intybus]|uniref:Uncharacterized protein n=1 Tax=Cichorium intybus TaxID=13427 RepID=A0ACB9BK39_CICIN|nr:hypothetical protein L2E82_33320 [Cichorium intybus]
MKRRQMLPIAVGNITHRHLRSRQLHPSLLAGGCSSPIIAPTTFSSTSHRHLAAFQSPSQSNSFSRHLSWTYAVAQGADCIITIGGIQSNHRQVLVDKDPGLTGNLLVERLVGAHIDLVSKKGYSIIGRDILKQSEKLRTKSKKGLEKQALMILLQHVAVVGFEELAGLIFRKKNSPAQIQ